MILPDAIDEDPRRQVTGLGRHPSGEFQSTTLAIGNAERLCVQHFRHAAPNDSAILGMRVTRWLHRHIHRLKFANCISCWHIRQWICLSRLVKRSFNFASDLSPAPSFAVLLDELSDGLPDGLPGGLVDALAVVSFD